MKLLIFSFILILSLINIINCALVEKFVDFADDFEANGLWYDHLESVKYYDSDEELINVKTPAMNVTRVGVWVYESLGPGGCCGGRLDIRAPLPTTGGRTVTLVLQYLSNVDLYLWWATPNGEKHERKLVANNERVNWPKETKSGNMINWSTSTIVMDNAYVFFEIRSLMGYDQHGYLLMDKILYTYEE